MPASPPAKIVAFQGRHTSFALLQRRMQVRDPERARTSGVPVRLNALDLPHARGFDLTGLELRHRKAVLRGLLTCVNEQEFVIGGYTDPKGARTWFGALLVGTYRGDELVYAGKVGTGFDDEALATLGRRLRSLEEGSAVRVGRASARRRPLGGPELVCQVGFAEWTTDGSLRHPRFLGLRRDKRARDVVRERPA